MTGFIERNGFVSIEVVGVEVDCYFFGEGKFYYFLRYGRIEDPSEEL